MAKKNRYEKEAVKKNFLSGLSKRLPTKGSAKNSLMETGLTLLVALGGGLVGSAIGRSSILFGLATTGIGHYTDNKLVQLLGVGMMTSPVFKKSSTVGSLEGLDGVKERLQAYREAVVQKLYLDKLLKKSAAGSGTAGLGTLEYFSYPDSSMNGALAALDDIEEQIADSARQFQGRLSGGDYELEMGDIEDRNY